MPSDPHVAVLWVWRHPRPREGVGRCIGHTDVPVDRRKAKRLAHRIRQAARRSGLPPEVWTSPLQRSWRVGAFLRRWGWRHHVDPDLREASFGSWDGRRWDDIGAQAVALWCNDFARHAPGGGESLMQLFVRCRAFLARHADKGALCVVGHAGWTNAAGFIARGHLQPPGQAADWPCACGYGALRVLGAGDDTAINTNGGRIDSELRR